jgi:FixJ family two-component response regulator
MIQPLRGRYATWATIPKCTRHASPEAERGGTGRLPAGSDSRGVQAEVGTGMTSAIRTALSVPKPTGARRSSTDAAGPSTVGKARRFENPRRTDPATTVGGSTPLRVLLIDDEIDDARLIARELQRSGYEVSWNWVQTAPELEVALQQQWDVITCDWVMPAFSAPAALKLLGEHGVDLPVIIVSGQAAEEVTVTAMKAGAHDVVSKHNLTRLGPAVERELRETEVRRARGLAEAALKQSEARYRRLFETAKDGIIILDAATGQITDVNPFLVELLGYRSVSSRPQLSPREIHVCCVSPWRIF